MNTSDRNHGVRLLENLKTFLARLFSDFNRILKSNTWDVRVQNPTVIPDPIDTRPEINQLIDAVANIPEPKETDMAPVVEAIKEIPQTVIPEMPTSFEVTNQPDMEKVAETIVEAIKCMPEHKPTDLSKLEKLMADKTMSVKEMKDVTSLLKMMVKKMHEEKPEKKDCGKKLVEQMEFYSDGSFRRSIEVFENMRVITERSLDDVYSYSYEEINADK